ncbi:MAG TPA: hypothetical protein PLN61_02290 [bacterium]|nr:hypothetical protein [bacterium]HQI47466.1 hypothetical protein [bacterium]HQJ65305.1 hypothetical protein [bacterium]
MKVHPAWYISAALLIHCAPQLPPDQVAAWKPQRPLAGAEITLYYNPGAVHAVLKNPAAVTAELLQMRGDQQPPLPLRLAMARKGSLWQVHTLLQPEARMLLLRFTAERTDDNRGESWLSLVFSDDGRPVIGAHLEKALLLQQGGVAGYPCRKDLHEAETELEAELTVWPQNIAARTALWDLLLRQYPVASTTTRVRNELRQVYESAGGDEEILAALLPFFYRTGQAYIAREIITESVALLPHGSVAAAARRWEISQEADPVKKAAMIAAFQHDFPRALPPQP